MAEEDTLNFQCEADFFCEEYGWMASHKTYAVRPDLAERWIGEGLGLPVTTEEKKNLTSGALIETPEDNLTRETATIKRRKR